MRSVKYPTRLCARMIACHVKGGRMLSMRLNQLCLPLLLSMNFPSTHSLASMTTIGFRSPAQVAPSANRCVIRQLMNPHQHTFVEWALPCKGHCIHVLRHNVDGAVNTTTFDCAFLRSITRSLSNINPSLLHHLLDSVHLANNFEPDTRDVAATMGKPSTKGATSETIGSGKPQDVGPIPVKPFVDLAWRCDLEAKHSDPFHLLQHTGKL